MLSATLPRHTLHNSCLMFCSAQPLKSRAHSGEVLFERHAQSCGLRPAAGSAPSTAGSWRQCQQPIARPLEPHQACPHTWKLSFLFRRSVNEQDKIRKDTPHQSAMLLTAVSTLVLDPHKGARRWHPSTAGARPFRHGNDVASPHLVPENSDLHKFGHH